MSGRFSDYRVEKWLRDLQTCYVALHYDNPDIAGSYAREVFGGAYTRCLVHFSDPSGRAMWNVSNITFAGLGSIVVTHMAAWDAAINGNMEMSAPLVNQVRIQAGGRYDLGANQFAISFR